MSTRLFHIQHFVAVTSNLYVITAIICVWCMVFSKHYYINYYEMNSCEITDENNNDERWWLQIIFKINYMKIPSVRVSIFNSIFSKHPNMVETSHKPFQRWSLFSETRVKKFAKFCKLMNYHIFMKFSKDFLVFVNLK